MNAQTSFLTCSSLTSLAVDGGHVVLVLPEPGLHVSAEGEDLAELWRGVVIEGVDRDSAVEFLYVVTSFWAQIVHFVVVLVPLLQEPLYVIQWVSVHGLHAFWRIAHGYDVVHYVAQV